MRCKECIWYRDCLKTDDTWSEETGCPFYDGYLPKDRSPLDREKEYDDKELGWMDYQIYVEGIGWVRCDPLIVVPK